MKYRVKPGRRHGPRNEYGPGDLVEMTEKEAGPFLDKLEPATEEPPAQAAPAEAAAPPDTLPPQEEATTEPATEEPPAQAAPKSSRRKG